jgi:hypothetical protein
MAVDSSEWILGHRASAILGLAAAAHVTVGLYNEPLGAYLPSILY